MLILLCKSAVFSQYLRQKAEESPLSTVFYLLSTTEKDSKGEEKACLARSFAKTSKADESRKTAEMIEKSSYGENSLISVVNNLIENKKLKEVNDFASYLLTRFEHDSYTLKNLWNPLIVLKRENEVVRIIDQFDDSDKIEAYFAMAEVYLKLKNPQNALKLIERISPLVEKAGSSQDEAEISLFYAKLGREKQSVIFAKSALKNVKWKTGILERDDTWIVDDVFKAYLVLGKYEPAHEMLEKLGKAEDAGRLIEIAESYLEKGNRRKAVEFLSVSWNLLDAKEYGDSFDLGKVVEIYLKLGETEKAERIAKNLSGSEYMQQKQSLNIADFYIKKKNTPKASEILDFALKETQKIDISEEENGMYWTSKRWDQARYQSQIALRFIDMKSDKTALEIISQLKKPYLRALALTEFVAVNIKRLPSTQLNSYLEEALKLLKQEKTDIFDSKRFDVLAITARSFADIGMKEKSNEVFAETLSILRKDMIEHGSDDSLLFAMCNIGIEFDKSQIKPSQKVQESLRGIIKIWEDDEY